MALLTLCLLATAAFAVLGVWQIGRRAGKLRLIATVNARLRAAPVPMPPPGAWRGDLAYTRVRVNGILLHDRETLVQAVTALGPGWWVLTPLRAGHRIVLVNRGFLPGGSGAPASRRAGQVTGRVTVTGLLRAGEPGGGFLRSNDPAHDRWYSRDVAAIARARRLGPVAPFFVDADATSNGGGYPVGGLTVVVFRNAHLGYALTWFALAGLSLFGVALLVRRPADA